MKIVLTDDLNKISGLGWIFVVYEPTSKEQLRSCMYDAVVIRNLEQAQMVLDTIEYVGMRTAEIDIMCELPTDIITKIGSVCDLRYSLQLDTSVVTPGDVAYYLTYVFDKVPRFRLSENDTLLDLRDKNILEVFSKSYEIMTKPGIAAVAAIDLFCDNLEDLHKRSVEKISQLSTQDSYALSTECNKALSVDIFTSVREFCEIYNRWEEVNGCN